MLGITSVIRSTHPYRRVKSFGTTCQDQSIESMEDCEHSNRFLSAFLLKDSPVVIDDVSLTEIQIQMT